MAYLETYNPCNSCYHQGDKMCEVCEFKHLILTKATLKNDILDEFVKRLINAFPEASRNYKSPAIYYDDFRYIIEEAAEEMKGEDND